MLPELVWLTSLKQLVTLALCFQCFQRQDGLSWLLRNRKRVLEAPSGVPASAATPGRPTWSAIAAIGDCRFGATAKCAW